MKYVLTFAAIGETATGLALLIVPSLVGQLLLGEQLAGVAIPVARVAGIALIERAVGMRAAPERALGLGRIVQISACAFAPLSSAISV
jgi:hypothetical protein